VTDDDALRAGPREWAGLAVISLPCLLYSMDLTVLNLAVPALSADLEPTSSQVLWIVDVYGFVAAGLLVTMGTLGDRIGRRKLLLGAAVAAAGALPGQLGAELLEASRGAFTQALQAAALTCAAIALGMAILVVVLLRSVPTEAEPPEQPQRKHAGADHSLDP